MAQATRVELIKRQQQQVTTTQNSLKTPKQQTLTNTKSNEKLLVSETTTQITTGTTAPSNKTKPSYKHIPHSQKPPHLVAKRNARERRRVQAVNQAFYKLRKCVPIQNRNKRVSKVKTLQRAIDYIRDLQAVLAEDEANQCHASGQAPSNGGRIFVSSAAGDEAEMRLAMSPEPKPKRQAATATTTITRKAVDSSSGARQVNPSANQLGSATPKPRRGRKPNASKQQQQQPEMQAVKQVDSEPVGTQQHYPIEQHYPPTPTYGHRQSTAAEAPSNYYCAPQTTCHTTTTPAGVYTYADTGAQPQQQQQHLQSQQHINYQPAYPTSCDQHQQSFHQQPFQQHEQYAQPHATFTIHHQNHQYYSPPAHHRVPYGPPAEGPDSSTAPQRVSANDGATSATSPWHQQHASGQVDSQNSSGLQLNSSPTTTTNASNASNANTANLAQLQSCNTSSLNSSASSTHSSGSSMSASSRGGGGGSSGSATVSGASSCLYSGGGGPVSAMRRVTSMPADSTSSVANGGISSQKLSGSLMGSPYSSSSSSLSSSTYSGSNVNSNNGSTAGNKSLDAASAAAAGTVPLDLKSDKSAASAGGRQPNNYATYAHQQSAYGVYGAAADDLQRQRDDGAPNKQPIHGQLKDFHRHHHHQQQHQQQPFFHCADEQTSGLYLVGDEQRATPAAYNYQHARPFNGQLLANDHGQVNYANLATLGEHQVVVPPGRHHIQTYETTSTLL